ncbi:MAG: amidohydrolase family protein [Gemmatimonadota bacterium]
MVKLPTHRLGVLVALAACSSPGRPAPSRPRPVALTHVTLIDGNGGPPLPGMTVIVADGRISRVGKDAKTVVPPGADTVNGTGKFLIPGLWDMHVHTSWDRHFTMPLMVANGVTGVREMFGKDVPLILETRREITEGELIGPRIVTAGPIVDGPDPAWPGSLSAATPTEGRAAVARVQEQGADFVKVYSSLSRETYFAIAAEARRREIPFAGHLPDAVSVIEASDSGQRSIEHLIGIELAASTDEANLRSRLTAATGLSAYLAEAARQQPRLLATFSPAKADTLFGRLRRNRTWQTPTLTVLRVGSDPAAPALSENPNLRYVPYALSGLWGIVRRMVAGDTSQARAALRRNEFDRQLEIVGRMYRDSVPLLVGTDEPNPYTIPGFSVHDEMGLMVKAGLTPMAALQAATRNPALFLGAQDSLGTIEPGKIAELVLLDANPLEDIANTRRIAAVVRAGRFLARPDLDRILADVERSRWRPGAAAVILSGAIVHRIPGASLAALIGIPLVVALAFSLIRRRRRARRVAPKTAGA